MSERDRCVDGDDDVELVPPRPPPQAPDGPGDGEEDDAAAAAAAVPLAAVRWMARNCPSNVQLARLTNVCMGWRDAAVEEISVATVATVATVETATPPIPTSPGGGRRSPGGVRAPSPRAVDVVDDDDGNEATSTRPSSPPPPPPPPPPPLASLLLPSMARALARQVRAGGHNGRMRRHHHPRATVVPCRSDGGAASASASASPKGGRRRGATAAAAAASATPPWAAAAATTDGGGHNGETYCLAWFHPRGIQLTAVSVERMGDYGDDYDEYYHGGGADEDEHDRRRSRRGVTSKGGGGGRGGRVTGGGHEKGNKSARMIISSGNTDDSRSGTSGVIQTCAAEWKGYREPMDVLAPFGYSSDVVWRVLTAAADLASTSDDLGGVTNAASSAPISSLPPSSREPQPQPRQNRKKPSPMASFSSTPPSYSPKKNLIKSRGRQGAGGVGSLVPDATFAVRGATAAKPDTIHNDYRTVAQFFPRVVLKKRPTPATTTTPGGARGGAPFRRQRAVQFLNAGGSRAVRMKTAPFACGPVPQPVTLFLVGVATEDGVFVSGLKRRFALGHLYPHSRGRGGYGGREVVVGDRSNVCICTESSVTTGIRVGGVDADGADPDAGAMAKLTLLECSGGGGNDCIAIDGDRSERADGEEQDCSNLFGGGGGGGCLTGSSSADDSGEEAGCDSSECSASSSSTSSTQQPDEGEIYRGRTGPGSWHCYTAVFDGTRSKLRVDGQQEELALEEEEAPTSSCSSTSFPSCGDGVLDGLTIGSDHKFDMSLCFGEGDDGEGEGAIAEIAVFNGRLDNEDITQVENSLMEKHGIPVAVKEMSLREGEFRRQAHALIVQPPPWKLAGIGVPLRVAANHPSVAWHRTNDVTGKAVLVPRIGCRMSTGSSSDW